jgi:hypothetical protein
MVTFVTEVTKGSPLAVVTFVTVLTNINIDFLITMITFATGVTQATSIHWLARYANGPVELRLSDFPYLVILGIKRKRVVSFTSQPLKKKKPGTP